MGIIFSSKRYIGLCFVVSAIASSAYAGGSDAFAVDWKREAVVGSAAVGVFALGRLATSDAIESGEAFGWFDDDWTFPYDPNLDTAGDIACFGAVAALPFLLDGVSLESTSTIAILYAESALFAIGAKDVLKASFGRPRPYLSYEDTPAELLTDEDRFFSFPSGHTTFAFMTAAFATTVFSKGDSSRGAKTLMGVLTFGAATATAVLRVAGGVHHPTDVLAGALIGTLAGIAVPLLHEAPSGKVRPRVDASGAYLTYSY